MTRTIIKVETYSGYKADERPVSFKIRERTLKVEGVIDRWFGEGQDYFKVRADDGYIYVLRHDKSMDEWEIIMMEKGGGDDPPGDGPAETYSYNILVSYSLRGFGRARAEVAAILKGLGDPAPAIEKTPVRGICGVRTSLDSREVVRRVRALYESDPASLGCTIKWAPADSWCGATIDEMKRTLEKEKGKIMAGERWAMKVEKRRSTALHSMEIIKELASLIDEKVDLDDPDKIVRVELLGDNACITVVRPGEVFSTAAVIH